MSNKSTQNEIRECLALSFVLHSIALLLLALNKESSILEKPKEVSSVLPTAAQPLPESASQQKISNPLDVPLLEVPCILYKQGTPGKGSTSQAAPPAKAFADGTVNTETSVITSDNTTVPEPVSIGSPSATNNNSKKEHPAAVKKVISPSTIPSTPTQITLPFSASVTTQDSSATSESIESISTTTLKIERVEETSSPSTFNVSDGTRKRKLKLSDLFKNLSSLPIHTVANEPSENGDGAPAVIVQGVIRYHSFVKGLVEHINNTSIGRNGNVIVQNLLSQGIIKQNLKLSLTLEKSGKVADAQILISSGSTELDSFWVKTAYHASPFTPLPGHFKRDVVRVELVTQL